MQYSDDAKTEFKLNSYHDKGVVLSALQTVRYRGGNTKTGETNPKHQETPPGGLSSQDPNLTTGPLLFSLGRSGFEARV